MTTECTTSFILINKADQSDAVTPFDMFDWQLVIGFAAGFDNFATPLYNMAPHGWRKTGHQSLWTDLWVTWTDGWFQYLQSVVLDLGNASSGFRLVGQLNPVLTN